MRFFTAATAFSALSAVSAHDVLRRNGKHLEDTCSAAELVETDIGELIIAQPIIADTTVSTTGVFTLCKGLTLTIDKAPTHIDTTYTLYETQTVTDVRTITFSNNVVVPGRPRTSSSLGASNSGSPSAPLPTQPPYTTGLDGFCYYGGSRTTTLTVPGGVNTPASLITAAPATSSAGIVVVPTSTLTIGYAGASTTTITLFAVCPSAGTASAIIVVETPTAVISSLAPSVSAARSLYYYGGTVVTTVLIPATQGRPASTLVATPASTVSGATALITETITIPATGTVAGTLTVFDGYPTVGIDPALLIVETIKPAGGAFCYYGGSAITTVTIPGQGGNAASTIIATPTPSAGGVIVAIVTTVTGGYSGPTTASLTIFPVCPTAGTNTATLFVGTPTGIPSSAVASSSPAPSGTVGPSATASPFFYFGGTVITTITFPPSGTIAGSTLTATPAATSGVTVNPLSTVTITYAGTATQTLTVFSASPTPGINNGVIVVEIPSPTTSSAISSSRTLPARSASAFYFGGTTTTVLTFTDALGGRTLVTADPAATSGVTVNFISTVTIPYAGASTTTITYFSASPTPGINNGVLVVETPAPTATNSGSPASSTFYYFGGSTVTTITTTGTDGVATATVVALPAATSGVTVNVVSTITIAYTGCATTSITLFSTTPTPGTDDGVLVAQTPRTSCAPDASSSTIRGASGSFFYIGSGSSVFTLTAPGTSSGGPSSTIIASPTDVSGVTPVYTTTITAGYLGSASTNIPVYSTRPTPGNNNAAFIVATPRSDSGVSTPAASNVASGYFYYQGTAVTTITLSGQGSSTVIVASPASVDPAVTPSFISSTTIGYGGATTTTLTLFPATPTAGTNSATLVVETPTATASNPPINTASGFFYYQGTAVTTLTLPGSGQGSSTIVVANPASVDPLVTPSFVSSVTIGYSGATTTTITLFPTSPTPGSNGAVLVVETPTAAVPVSTGSTFFYYQGTAVTTLTLPGSGQGSSTVVVASPASVDPLVTPSFVSTVTIGYSGTTTTRVTLFSNTPTAGTNGAVLIVETPTATGPISTSSGFFYYQGTVVTTLTLPGAAGQASSTVVVASPASVDPLVTPSFVSTVTIGYSGTTTTRVTLFSNTPTAGTNGAVLVIETPTATAPANTSPVNTASGFFYYQGTVVTTLTLPGIAGQTSSRVVIASPASVDPLVTPTFATTYTVGYGGATTTTITLFSGSPTAGTNTAVLVVETPTAGQSSSVFAPSSVVESSRVLTIVSQSTLASSGGTITARPAPTQNFYYVGGTTTTTIAITGADGSTTVVVASPLPTSLQPALEDLVTITVPYNGATTTTITLVDTTPVSGRYRATVVVETPAASLSIGPITSGAPLSTPYYIGGSSTTTLTITGADGSTTTLVASPLASTNGVTPAFVTTITVGYSGTVVTSVTVFSVSPTAGNNFATLVVETPTANAATSSFAPGGSSGVLSTPFYIGGSTVTTLTITGTDGATSLVTASPLTATSGIVVTFVSTVTIQYSGTSATTITLFPTSPVPGNAGATLVVETPANPASTPASSSVSRGATPASASFFYIGGTTSTVLTATISGTLTTFTAAPVSGSGVTPSFVGTLTGPYTGTAETALPVFTTSPTPGVDDALLVIQTPVSGAATGSPSVVPTDVPSLPLSTSGAAQSSPAAGQSSLGQPSTSLPSGTSIDISATQSISLPPSSISSPGTQQSPSTPAVDVSSLPTGDLSSLVLTLPGVSTLQSGTPTVSLPTELATFLSSISGTLTNGGGPASVPTDAGLSSLPTGALSSGTQLPSLTGGGSVSLPTDLGLSSVPSGAPSSLLPSLPGSSLPTGQQGTVSESAPVVSPSASSGSSLSVTLPLSNNPRSSSSFFYVGSSSTVIALVPTGSNDPSAVTGIPVDTSTFTLVVATVTSTITNAVSPASPLTAFPTSPASGTQTGTVVLVQTTAAGAPSPSTPATGAPSLPTGVTPPVDSATTPGQTPATTNAFSTVTVTIVIPTGGSPFISTMTMTGGSVVTVFVGVPTGTFIPGTITGTLVPGADPFTTTIVNNGQTAVIIGVRPSSVVSTSPVASVPTSPASGVPSLNSDLSSNVPSIPASELPSLSSILTVSLPTIPTSGLPAISSVVSVSVPTGLSSPALPSLSSGVSVSVPAVSSSPGLPSLSSIIPSSGLPGLPTTSAVIASSGTGAAISTVSNPTPSPATSNSCAPMPTASCAAAQIAGSAQTVIDALNDVTVASQNLQSSANNLANSPAGLIAAAQVGAGLTNIANTLTQDLQLLATVNPFDAECDQVAVVVALTKFVQVHQALLNIIIGKSGLISQVPGAGPPVAAGVRLIESVVDAIALRLIGLLPNPTEKCQANVQKEAIDGTLAQANSAYAATVVSSAVSSASAATGTCAPLPTASCAAAQIAGSAQSVIDAINAVTQASQDLQNPANNIGTSFTGLAAAGQVALGLTNIASTLGQNAGLLGSLQPFDAECDQLAVVIALTKFVQVHQALLNIIIGKSGLIASVPLAGPPVAAAIRAIENVVDTVAFALISLIPSPAEKCEAVAQKSAIDGTLGQAKVAYPAAASVTATLPQSTPIAATTSPAGASETCVPLPTASCAAVQIAESAQTVIDLIDQVTTLSQNLQAPANNIDLSITGLAAAATVASGFTNIVAALTRDITLLASVQPFDAVCDQAAIVTALTKFVQVHQALLNIVIGKSGLIATVPLAGPPIAAAIRAIEGVVDTIAFRLIALLGSSSAKCAAADQQAAIGGTLSQATAAYPATGATSTSPSAPSATATSCPALATGACAAAQVAGSAQVIIDLINAVSTASQNLIAPANNLGTSFAGLAAATQLVQGFTSITSTVTTAITTLGQINPFDIECDQIAIVTALTKFVQIHQALLNVVIGKSALISRIPLAGPPIAAALRALEGVVDTIAFRIIALIPGASCQATEQKNSLDATFGQAIAAYPITIGI